MKQFHTTWMNLKTVTLNKRSHTRRNCPVELMQSSQTAKRGLHGGGQGVGYLWGTGRGLLGSLERSIGRSTHVCSFCDNLINGVLMILCFAACLESLKSILKSHITPQCFPPTLCPGSCDSGVGCFWTIELHVLGFSLFTLPPGILYSLDLDFTNLNFQGNLISKLMWSASSSHEDKDFVRDEA